MAHPIDVDRLETDAYRARYDDGLIVMRPLKDGYYLVVSLEAERPLAPALHATAGLAVQLDAEL